MTCNDLDQLQAPYDILINIDPGFKLPDPTADPVQLEWLNLVDFRCKKCHTMARVHPNTIQVWGCLKCGYTTMALSTYFEFCR